MNTVMCHRVQAALLAFCGLVILMAGPAHAQVLTGDADRFARLMEQTAYRPSVSEIERHYIAPASPALRGLLARDDIDAEQLHSALGARRYAYRHALELCLPVMQRSADQVAAWLAGVADVLGVPAAEENTQVVVLFGAGSTGGLAQARDVVVALEVQCRFADSPVAAEQVLASAVRHEAVHVHQLQRQQPDAVDSLLRQAMIEGLADWLSMRQLGAVPPQARQRTVYGNANEGRLWQEFRDEMHGEWLGQWMYGAGRPGEPADLGYWIGSQIVAAYIAQAGVESRAQAMQALLLLDSPGRILDESGYNPE